MSEYQERGPAQDSPNPGPEAVQGRGLAKLW
jgi:hypothetical protein